MTTKKSVLTNISSLSYKNQSDLKSPNWLITKINKYSKQETTIDIVIIVNNVERYKEYLEWCLKLRLLLNVDLLTLKLIVENTEALAGTRATMNTRPIDIWNGMKIIGTKIASIGKNKNNIRFIFVLIICFILSIQNFITNFIKSIILQSP